MDVIVEEITQVWAGSRADIVALDRFTHRFASRRFSCLLGPSGCGKSTLLQIVGGLEPATRGTVRIADAARPGEARAPGADSVMVWQGLNLFPWRSVLDNVAFGLEVHGMPKRERHERARALVASVGLAGFEHHLPGQLSGGMRQRVALARALVLERPILLMDEPFAALDAQTRESLQDELLRIWETSRTTILFITHGIDEAVYLGQRVAVMTSRPGRIKRIVEIPSEFRQRQEDVRSTAEFGQLRHQIWALLHDEVLEAEQQYRAKKLGGAQPRPAAPERGVSAHG